MDGDKVQWIKNIRSTDFFQAGDATWLAEAMHPEKDGLNLPYSLALARIAPGKASLSHRLAQGELYYFISGEGRVHSNGHTASVGAQTLWFVPANKEQWVENTGTSDLVFLCIVSPPWSEAGEEIL